MSSRENRRAPRAKHDSVLEIFDAENHFITGVGRLVDFSTVGACFSSTKTLSKGEKLHIRLRLLKEGVFEGPAEVVWARKKANANLYGIAFGNIRKLQR